MVFYSLLQASQRNKQRGFRQTSHHSHHHENVHHEPTVIDLLPSVRDTPNTHTEIPLSESGTRDLRADVLRRKSTKSLSQGVLKRSKLLPWFPHGAECVAKTRWRRRGLIERVHLSVSNPETCRMAWWVMTGVLLVILVSTAIFVEETRPHWLEYSSDCEHCKPLRGADRSDDDKVAARRAMRASCTSCEPTTPHVFGWLEIIFMSIFTFEYMIKLLTCWANPTPAELKALHNPTYQPPQPTFKTFALRVKAFVANPLNVIDLVAILPFLIQLALKTSSARATAVLRVFRLVRLLRMMRFDFFAEGIRMFGEIMRGSIMTHSIFIVLLFLSMVVLGSFTFGFEQGTWDPKTGDFLRVGISATDPHEPSTFSSIPDSIWWVLVTFVMVGYGDLAPNTELGRFAGSVLMILGTLGVAVTLSVLADNRSAALVREMQKHKNKRERALHQTRLLFRAFESADGAKMRDAFEKWRCLLDPPPPEPVHLVVARVVAQVLAEQRHAHVHELEARVNQLMALRNESMWS